MKPPYTSNPKFECKPRLAATLLLAGWMAASLAAPAPARAAFHIAVIDEVMSGLSGTDDVQFVEIRMLIGGQGIVGGSKLSAFDANGAFLRVVLTVPGNVSGGAGRAWIMGSNDFAAASGITPDFTFASSGGVGLEPTDGMVCWGKPFDETNADLYVDCVTYGNYVGPAPSHSSAPNPIDPFGHSLVRTQSTNSSADDFACNDPAEPENNAMAVGSIAASDPCPVCGNDIQEGSEECDGTDDAACPGACDGSCLCGNVCGNDVLEAPQEQCDGTDDAACPGFCQVNCSCGPEVPLGKADQKCANGFTKTAAKVVATYGKAAAGCVKDFGNEKTADDPATCVSADPKGKLGKAEAKLDATVDKFCTAPYALDCVAPCDATDSGGVSDAVDDDDELKDCLRCLDKAVSWSGAQPTIFKGVHGTILDGATLATATSDAALAKCQAQVVKGYEKLFATQLKEQVSCLKNELKNSSIPPVGDTCIGADPKTKVAKATVKLDKTIAKCTPPDPFDGGACATTSGTALTACLAQVTTCKACQWGKTVLGESSVDCDIEDNGIADASCN